MAIFLIELREEGHPGAIARKCRRDDCPKGTMNRPSNATLPEGQLSLIVQLSIYAVTRRH